MRWIPTPGAMVAFALLAAAAVPAAAQDAQVLRAAALAATCANCHGTQGQAVPGATVPGLAGMPASYLVEQMNAFRAGTRPATVMHQIAKGFSETQIDTLAAYFAARQR
jgi:cytochrome c553